jgi:hypothetical protein
MASEVDQIKALTARDAYGALGLEDDPELAFAGIRALRQMADFCERLSGPTARPGRAHLGVDRRLGGRQRASAYARTTPRQVTTIKSIVASARVAIAQASSRGQG